MKKALPRWARSLLVILALSLGAWWWSGCDAQEDQAPPNVVLIILDTVRSDRLGCYGFQEEISPEIDDIAAQGVLFEDTIAQCSWTRPSFGSFLTSLYPRTVGIYKEAGDILSDEFLTLPEVLRDNGYTTIGATANPNLNRVFNFQQGFDEYTDSGVVWRWMTPGAGQRRGMDVPVAREIFQSVLSRLRSGARQPVYLQITLMDAHYPWPVRDEFKSLFVDRPFHQYHQAVRQLSVDVAEFIDELGAMPEWDDTLFVIMSDHGEGLDSHPDVEGARAHGSVLYESQLRVPLIFLHRGHLAGGRRIPQRVQLLDLMPTILDYVGVAVPGNLEGRSLLGLLGEDPVGVEPLEYVFAETDFRGTRKTAIYSDEWKFVENRGKAPDVNPRELQPMGERENGKATDRILEHPTVADQLQGALREWEAQYPRANPTAAGASLTDEERKQLKSIGYTGE